MPANITINIANGRSVRNKLTPAAFIDNNSKRSPIFPKDMSDASNIASGNANGTNVRAAYPKNFARISIGNPFPTNSSTYFQRNCIITTNKLIQKVPAKSVRKFFSTYISSFFMTRIISIRDKISLTYHNNPPHRFST